jgi:hypothetical protein
MAHPKVSESVRIGINRTFPECPKVSESPLGVRTFRTDSDNAQRYHELANCHRPTDGASLARAILGLTATGLTAWDTAQALKLPLAYCLEVMARGQRDAL